MYSSEVPDLMNRVCECVDVKMLFVSRRAAKSGVCENSVNVNPAVVFVDDIPMFRSPLYQ